jgi:NADPH-dependent glutamate synthase beta subunit-like oxidoreductase
MYFNKIRSGNPKGKSAAGDCDNDDDGDNLKENQVTIVDKDVVIIGGGCAGVECASKLISNGFKNIVVLEGRSSVSLITLLFCLNFEF